tara:strand:- start:2289 stop:2639 length:351 start_codon:yes stop_codon:yes gene_type:complete
MRWLILAGYLGIAGCSADTLPMRSYAVHVQFEPGRYHVTQADKPQHCELDLPYIKDLMFDKAFDDDCDNKVDEARDGRNVLIRSQMRPGDRTQLDLLLEEGQRQFLEKYKIYKNGV